MRVCYEHRKVWYKMSQKNERNSSVELLRIFGMLMIMSGHYVVHGGFPDFTYDTLSGAKVFLQIMSMYGSMACSVYAMITGYYLIDVREGGSGYYKRIIPLICEIYFYSISIYILMCIINADALTIKDLIRALFPTIFGQWYVVYYLLLYLFIPYINMVLQALSKQEYFKLLIMIFVIWSIIQTASNNALNFGQFDFFVFTYTIGGFIKLHLKPLKPSGRSKCFILSVLLLILISCSAIAFDCVGMLTKKNIFVSHYAYFRNYNMVLALSAAIVLVILATNINFTNKYINLIASSLIGVYLIHDNRTFRKWLWEGIWPNADYVNNPFLHAPIKVLLVFLVCIVIDQIRKILLERKIRMWLDKNWERVYQKLKLPFKSLFKYMDK